MLDSSRFIVSWRRYAVRAAIAAACVAWAAIPSGRLDAQAPPPATLSIGGDVPHPMTVTMADLKAMPRTAATVQEDGHPVTYEGVLVSELLGRAGAPLGHALSGNALTTYVRAAGSDGYEVVYSLAELDPAMTSNGVIVADSVDGKPLFDFQGPLRLVAPHDARPARSVRMLVRLDVVQLKK